MEMTPERFKRMEAVIQEISDAPPEQRTAILDRLCAGDPELRRDVQRILDSDGAGTFINDGISRGAAAVMAPEPQQERYGRYQIIRRIGHGGMGVVYEAVRVDDYLKRVALKVVKQELDSEFARTQFQQERQLLATLEHPYIARLLDGGETASGTPYLVLEFVDGEPIDRYCARLDRDARLRLFLKVCEAVEYAHRNLVIHRDLKPANIMVTANGEPKLLDFGIARLLDPGATATQTALTALTPHYASPEQVRGQTMTTASDVYSLGVILYELLTGRLPYEIKTPTPIEIERVVCETAPVNPGLSPDLDNIILMALRKEPARRYGSVQQLADDLVRSMENLPVKARPDTFWYRTGKYARRHWAGLISAGIAAAGLLIGSGLALQQAHRAERRFEQVRTLAFKFIFDFNDDIQYIPGTTKARERVVATARDYLDSLAAESGNDAKLLKGLSAAYVRLAVTQGQPGSPNLGQPGPALESYSKAIVVLEKVVALDRTHDPKRRLCNAYSLRSELLQSMGRLKEALADANRASALAIELVSKPPVQPDDYLVATAAEVISGNVHLASRDSTTALADYRRGVEYQRHLMEANPDSEARYGYAVVLEAAGNAMALRGDFAGALDIFHEEEKVVDILLRDNPFDVRKQRIRMVLDQNLGTVLGTNRVASLMQRDQGVEHFRKMQARAEEMYTADPHNQNTIFDIANSLLKSSDLLYDSSPREALQIGQRALELIQKLSPDPQADYLRAEALLDMVRGYGAIGDFAAAHRALDEGETLVRKQTGGLPDQTTPQRAVAGVYYLQTELAFREGKLNTAVDAGSRFLLTAQQNVADEPDNVNALYDLSRGWDLLTLIHEKRGDRDQVRAWQQKKLDAWKDWDQHHTPNPYSKAQQEDAAAALVAVNAAKPIPAPRH